MEVYYVVQYYYKIKQKKDINLFWRFRALLEVLILGCRYDNPFFYR